MQYPFIEVVLVGTTIIKSGGQASPLGAQRHQATNCGATIHLFFEKSLTGASPCDPEADPQRTVIGGKASNYIKIFKNIKILRNYTVVCNYQLATQFNEFFPMGMTFLSR